MLKRILITLSVVLLFSSSVFAQNIVASKTKVISTAPTLSASQYTTGMLIGGKQTLTGAGACDTTIGYPGLCSGIINSMIIGDLDKQAANFDIIIFSSNPSATTFTERSALTIADADIPKITCVISVTTQVAFADNGMASNQSGGCIFDAKATLGTVYAAAVIRSTATYATNGLDFRFGILQD